MADSFDQSISFTGQKRRARPVRRVQVSTHFDDLNTQTMSLATPPPPAPEPMILTEAANPSDLKLPQVKDAGYAVKSDEAPIDEFAFLTGILPKHKPAESETKGPITESKPEAKPQTKAEAKVEKSTESKPEAKAETKAETSTEPKPEAKAETKAETKAEKSTESKPEAKAETKTVTPPPDPVKLETAKAQPIVVAPEKDPAIVKPEMTETKTAPIISHAKSLQQSAAAVAVAPPIPERLERKSFVSVNSEGNRMDFTESDAGAIFQRISLVESDVSGSKRDSFTDSTASADHEPKETMKASAAIIAPKTNKEALTPTKSTEVKDELLDSLKPRMLPVLPIAQSATKQPENFTPSPPIVASNIRPSSVVSNNGKIPLATGKDGKTSPIKLATYEPQNEEFGRLKENFGKQAKLLEKERNDRLKLEHQFESLKAKCEAQDEALRYKNEKVSKMEQEFIGLKNEVTSLKLERERVQNQLQQAETELKEVSGKNAVEFIQKSDEVNTIKEQLDNLACAIGEKDKEIAILNSQLKDSQDTHINVIFDGLNDLRSFDDEFITAVEAEILKMEHLLKEESEYNAKLQKEVESEYSFWKRTLSENKTVDKE